MDLRIIVTGGSGFIGTNLVEHFVVNGDQVINLDIRPPRNQAHGSYWEKIDLLDAAALRKSVHTFQPDIILHMGARTDLDGKSISDYSVNTVGVSNLLGAIEGLATLHRVIFASSRLVCRIGYQPVDEFDYCPTTLYGESKVEGEKIVRGNAARIPSPWVIVRPTSIWGPWFDVPYKTFFLAIAKGRYFHPKNYNMNKSFGYVGNTVYQLHKLMMASVEMVDGKTFYLADYPPTNVKKMADLIQKTMGVKKVKTLSLGMLRSIAFVGDILKQAGWQQTPLTSFRLNNLLTEMVYALKSLEEIVGELPYSLESGIKETVAWMRENNEI